MAKLYYELFIPSSSNLFLLTGWLFRSAPGFLLMPGFHYNAKIFGNTGELSVFVGELFTGGGLQIIINLMNGAEAIAGYKGAWLIFIARTNLISGWISIVFLQMKEISALYPERQYFLCLF